MIRLGESRSRETRAEAALGAVVARLKPATLELLLFAGIHALDEAQGDADIERTSDEAEPFFPKKGEADWSDEYPGDPFDAEDEPDMGAEEIGEIEQMTNDVPCFAVYSLDIGEDGKRVFLGMSNLNPSFVGNARPA